ncbi:uncharacterized protein LOC120122145 [Hibiscus syriacus]|uniref:uncharacterized protein LOC120122145 n=1 Tax=Hibiscus syriacus TaxID=106335 RepID=UPI0019246A5D|nr:uncharacterized protein LOC120122145 [Hibiscus syriacus]
MSDRRNPITVKDEERQSEDRRTRINIKLDEYKNEVNKVLGSGGANQTDLWLKLYRLKGKLRRWNVEHCEDFNTKVRSLEDKINKLEEAGNRGPLDDRDQAALRAVKLELWDALQLQENLWRQKSRMNWVQLRDLNTSFFHKTVKIRAKRKVIIGLKFGDKYCGDPSSLKKLMFSHFKNHFNCKKRSWMSEFNLAFKSALKKKAKKLEAPFLIEEIKHAI